MNRNVKKLKTYFICSKWTFRVLAGLLLVYAFVTLFISFFHPEEEKLIRSLNILFLIGLSLSVHFLYVKMVLITFGLASIGLLIHAVISESILALVFTLFFIISGSEFIIVATIYKEQRLQALLDQRYSAATIY